MEDGSTVDALNRIADALERISQPSATPADLAAGPAFHWNGSGLAPIGKFAPVKIDLLTAIDDQKLQLLENSRRFAKGFAAHDVLLWGSRGMGKSALVKSAVLALNDEQIDIAIVEASSDHLETLPGLFDLLGESTRPFILFIDDIGFDEDNSSPRILRSMLEGGVAARPANVRLYTTSNRRHIVSRNMAEQDDPINPRDVVDDKLALSDRFGLRLGFHAANQDDYLAIISRYAEVHDMQFDDSDALLWSKKRGSRSGRVAWQYIVELAGRAGKSLD